MFNLKSPLHNSSTPLLKSQLYNEKTFYDAFTYDIAHAKKSIIIESPFITHKRLRQLRPFLESALHRGVKIVINTRDPHSHDDTMQQQAAEGIAILQKLGVTVLYTGNHHRKIAIVDAIILWEGSLNILSQVDSCEFMRRIESVELTEEMIGFTGLKEWYS